MFSHLPLGASAAWLGEQISGEGIPLAFPQASWISALNVSQVSAPNLERSSSLSVLACAIAHRGGGERFHRVRAGVEVIEEVKRPAQALPAFGQQIVGRVGEVERGGKRLHVGCEPGFVQALHIGGEIRQSVTW